MTGNKLQVADLPVQQEAVPAGFGARRSPIPDWEREGSPDVYKKGTIQRRRAFIAKRPSDALYQPHKPREERKPAKVVRFSLDAVLQQVITDGDVEEFKRLLDDHGRDLAMECDSTGELLTIRAVVHSQHEILQLLIDAGADLTAVDCEGWTVLHAAVVRDELECAKAILKTPEAKLTNSRALRSLRPMDIARSKEMASLLLQADLESFRKELTQYKDLSLVKDCPQLVSCQEGEAKLLWPILSQKNEDARWFVLEKEKEFGVSLLNLAVKKNYSKLALVLLEQHLVDIDAVDESQLTALHHAAQVAHTDMILLLKKFGANHDCVDKNGHTPAYLATPLHCTWLSTL